MTATYRTEAGRNIVYDDALLDSSDPALHDARIWKSGAGFAAGSAPGRGEVTFLTRGDAEWVLRHYRRGGAIGRVVADAFFFTGPARTRSFREWHLLDRLYRAGLPVPRPVAACYVRNGMNYRADLITLRIPAAQPLSAWLARGAVEEDRWAAVGAMIRRFHAARIWHADLTAHNILLNEDGEPFLLDFDRGRERRGNAWCDANLRRLLRSLRKIGPQVVQHDYPEPQWRWLLAGYGTGAGLA